MCLCQIFISLCGGADVFNEFHTVGAELIKVLHKAAAPAGHIQGHRILIVAVLAQPAEYIPHILGSDALDDFQVSRCNICRAGDQHLVDDGIVDFPLRFLHKCLTDSKSTLISPKFLGEHLALLRLAVNHRLSDYIKTDGIFRVNIDIPNSRKANDYSFAVINQFDYKYEDAPFIYKKEGKITFSSSGMILGDEHSEHIANNSFVFRIDPDIDYLPFTYQTANENLALRVYLPAFKWKFDDGAWHTERPEEISYNDILYKRLIVEALKKREASGGLMVPSFVDLLKTVFEKNDIKGRTSFDADSDFGIQKEAWKAILAELVDSNGNTSLSHFGLIGIETDVSGSYKKYHINENEFRSLCSIFAASMMTDAALKYGFFHLGIVFSQMLLELDLTIMLSKIGSMGFPFCMGFFEVLALI